jgi:outer membrane protein TolC
VKVATELAGSDADERFALPTNVVQPTNIVQPTSGKNLSGAVRAADPLEVDGETASRPPDTNGALPPRVLAAEQVLITGDESTSSLERLVGLALANNPRLRAANQRVAAAIHAIEPAKALPDPVFANTFYPLHDQALQTAAGRLGNQMSLQQRVPWPEKRKAAADIARRELEVARAEVERIAADLAEEVQVAYYELWYIDRALVLLDESAGVVDQLEEIATSRYAVGASQRDVLRARNERDRLATERLRFAQRREAALAELAALVGMPLDFDLPRAEPVALDALELQLDGLIELAEACNPTLRGLAQEVARDRQRLRAACLEDRPDLQFGIQWGLISDEQAISPVADGHDTIGWTVSTTLPIWRAKNTAVARAAEHRLQSTAETLASARDGVRGEIRRLVFDAEQLRSRLGLFREQILPRTRETLELTIADYRSEEVNFNTVVETYREVLMFETQVAELEAALATTMARLQRAVGCPIGK